MKKGIKIGIIIVVIVAAAAAAGYLGLSRLAGGEGPGSGFSFAALTARRRGGPPPAEKSFAVPVAVATARQGEAEETLLLYGSVVAEKEVSIFATVSGTIKNVAVAEGQRVAKDQVLAVIDRDQAGLKFAPAQVESTIDGVVKSILTEEGATVSPAAPLFQIVDMDVVEVVVNVPEKRIAEVRRGQAAEISVVAYPDRVFHGTVDRLSPVVDPGSRTLETRIRVGNSAYRLKPGMFAEARIVLRRRENAVMIPLSALVEKEGRQLLFVVDGERVRAVSPEIAFIEGETVVVDSGVSPGDRVVVIGQQSLNDGDAVTVAEEKS